MKITGETKLFIGIILTTLLILFGGVYFMSKPTPALPKEALISSKTHTLGNVNAKTYLVEFSDYQCPACKTFKPTIDQIVEKNKDKMLFAYRHFPLTQHKFSLKAALAAEAAAEQGKFWEMSSLLFDNQEKLSDEIFSDLAKKLNLDLKKFQTSFDNPELKNIITTDQQYGEKAGVDATPSFYLNGQKIEPSSPENLSQIVEKAISSN
jgi:protein-disulfide isomerase